MNVALRAWLILVVVTLLLAVLLLAGEGRVAAMVWLAILGFATLLKARIILLDYLCLRSALGWRQGFMAGLVGLVVIVYGLLMAGVK